MKLRPPTPMQDVIDRFVTWAQRRPDVRAGVILGSWARNDTPADNLSDLDLNFPIHREEGSENWRFFPLNFILEICSSEHSNAFISPEARLQRAHD